MPFSAATCVRSSALGFLKKVYPSKGITDTKESAGPLLDFVEQDIVRIQDPLMHGDRIEVIPEKKWTEDPDMRWKIIKACELLHE